MPENKRKKFHDKDKYYRLAKEQGLRSRAAFKLVQINRKFHFLENARVVLDLCAAPGGWTQIASRTMATSSAGRGGGAKGSNSHIIVAVDILPIRHIGQNVITLVGDITTAECHTKIKQTLSGASADVVLCDGAPNVGANYDRDAYAQNDIALQSLKCATVHLRNNGTFVTKLYRSRDYNSYLWVVRQLFREVKAVKPVSSRAQSAEIFLVCLGYKAPDKIDPKLLDSKCVFEQVYDQDGNEIDAANGTKQSSKVTIFHKQFEKQSKGRRRQGYDMTNLDATMRKINTVVEFINSPDPIQLLTDCTGFTFICGETCSNRPKTESPNNDGPVANCPCLTYLQHKLTTPDIKECLADLKVLNRGDFKSLISWRLKMQDVRDEHIKNRAAGIADGNKADETVGSDGEDDQKNKDNELDSEEEEERVQKQIAELKERKLRQKKKIKKKEHAEMAKRRKRAAFGMDLDFAGELPEHDQIFSLAAIGSKGDLDAIHEIDLDNVPRELMEGDEEEEEQEKALDFLQNMTSKELLEYKHRKLVVKADKDELDPETGYSYRLDKEMDSAYDMYLSKTKNKAAKTGTRMEKRQKVSRKKKLLQEAQEDDELITTATKEGLDEETKQYVKLLDGGKRDSDDSDDGEDEEDDDGFHAKPVTPDEHMANKRSREPKQNTDELAASDSEDEMSIGKDEKSKNPLIFELPDTETASAKTARWFSNPIFQSIGLAAHAASSSKRLDAPKDEIQSDDEESNEGPVDAEELIANWPKTDKQVRHERRLKALARKERKEAKKAKLENDTFEVVSSGETRTGAGAGNMSDDSDLDELDEAKKAKVLEARKLIKAGMGNLAMDGKTKKGSFDFEVVSNTAQALGLTVHDNRKYDDEEYDSDDQARTLALATMMLRNSKAKSFVDASYNRYAWNDPEELPDWFLDDEKRHYRPQLPIPQALVEKMKARYIAMSTKPIKKVAEARARKSKRAKQKLSAAKKKAETVAQNPDMSEAMKLKAISKAMRGGDANSKAGKKLVVAKKNGTVRPGKGMKMVDKRQKSDMRGMKRAADKKSGKKAKKRRH